MFMSNDQNFIPSCGNYEVVLWKIVAHWATRMESIGQFRIMEHVCFVSRIRYKAQLKLKAYLFRSIQTERFRKLTH